MISQHDVVQLLGILFLLFVSTLIILGAVCYKAGESAGHALGVEHERDRTNSGRVRHVRLVSTPPPVPHFLQVVHAEHETPDIAELEHHLKLVPKTGHR